MADNRESQDVAPFQRSGAVTLADLGLFVFGVALVLGLPGNVLHRPEPSWMGPYPAWKWAFFVVFRSAARVGLALLPVMVGRRARLGGMVRPAELLLAVCAGPLIAEQFDLAAWNWDWNAEPFLEDFAHVRVRFRSLEPHLRFAPQTFVLLATPRYWFVRLAVWSFFGVAALRLVRGWRVLSDRARSIWLVIALLGSFAWLDEPKDRLLVRYGNELELGPVTSLVLWTAGRVLIGLAPAVVGWAALRELRRDRRRIGVMGWAGLVLAAVELVAALTLDLESSFAGDDWAGFPPRRQFFLYGLYVLAPLASALLGLAIVRATERRRTRQAG